MTTADNRGSFSIFRLFTKKVSDPTDEVGDLAAYPNAGTDRACMYCGDAGMDFDWCRWCGRGLPAPPAEPTPPRPLFNGRGCGHPPDPVAVIHDGRYACHCGWALNPADGMEVDVAPGPVVYCQSCGCHVALVEQAAS